MAAISHAFTYRERRALITGASSGIGAAFARALAAKGMDLLLTGRSAERLEQLAGQLHAAHGVAITPLAADLATPEGCSALRSAADAGPRVHLLINNAGFGEYGTFTERDPDVLTEMLRVNIEAVVRLTRSFLPEMRARRDGGIINVASVAGFQPVPYMATYGATKAFVLQWSQALSEECRADGVRIVALCPGGTDTGFFARANMVSAGAAGRALMAPEAVVSAALRALERGRDVAIPGWFNRLTVEAQRFTTRRMVTRAGAAVFRRRGKEAL